MGKPVITGDSPAVRKVLIPDEEVCLCLRADGTSLALAIRRLRDDPDLRRRVADRGYHRIKQAFTIEQIGRQYAAHLNALTNRPK